MNTEDCVTKTLEIISLNVKVLLIEIDQQHLRAFFQ